MTTMKTSHKNPWTAEQEAGARRLIAAKAAPEIYLSEIGHTRSSAYKHIRWVDDPSYRAAHTNSNRVAARLASKVVHSSAPPPEVLADAARRATAPRSLTALLCGDPEPGRSMLDQRHGARA
jgi:hypothetical protein